MNQWWWFSNLCPFLNVFDAEKISSEFGSDFTITTRLLSHCGFSKAANWLENNLSHWLKYKAQIPKWLDHSSGGRFQITYWDSKNYPQALKNINHPPGILFSRGNLSVFEKPSIAVIGARNPTNLGRLWVQAVIPKLTEVTIISGGARGIDAEAHWASLNSNGKTVAFLPGGVETPYPQGNNLMFERILESQGALISEFPPETIVRRENFHRRNRLIAGSAMFIVVVEASQKSGTIMTAHHALKEHVDVHVVPGPPMVTTYAGSLDLLFEGAYVVRDHQDILNAIAKKNTLKNMVLSPTLGS
ncbi:MAG: DNA-processing protein DprA [Oligoflexia bacterium]|nr:DNA-processing protein DprA [Oligoflexia bacterium]